ncbi:hypothetical protein RND81_07G094800 [Saponaria officinalis]|uniref:Water stress and hypersensitive response domain-containing protein n=1 Tax=Saponaria officinalis TaxID=3572 RepID=A0AAW1JLJ3_SAPOF
MASSDNPEIIERFIREIHHDKEKKNEEKDRFLHKMKDFVHDKEKKNEGKDGFLHKMKDFVHDIGEKIEGAIGFGKPTADVSGIHISEINLHKADIVVDVLVNNPNPVPIPLKDINYLIESDGRKLISGLIHDAGTIHAHGIIPYKVKVDLIIDVPVFGRITIPLEKTGEIPVPYKPDIDVEKKKFEKFSLEQTIATLHLILENMNDFDLGLKALDYEVWLGDVSIGGTELEKTANIEKKAPKDFGSALWDMIRGCGTGYTMKGNINVNTSFGDMKLPISKKGGTTRFKKKKEDGGRTRIE